MNDGVGAWMQYAFLAGIILMVFPKWFRYTMIEFLKALKDVTDMYLTFFPGKEQKQEDNPAIHTVPKAA